MVDDGVDGRGPVSPPLEAAIDEQPPEEVRPDDVVVGRERLGGDVVADHHEAHELVPVMDGPVARTRDRVLDRILEVAVHRSQVALLAGSALQPEHGRLVSLGHDVAQLNGRHGRWVLTDEGLGVTCAR